MSYTDAKVELVGDALADYCRALGLPPEIVRPYGAARAVLSALAATPDLWQYAMPDPDAPGGLTVFDGTPRQISPRSSRRPLSAVGPWQPVSDNEETTAKEN